MCKTIFGFDPAVFNTLGDVFENSADVPAGHTIIGEAEGLIATLPTTIICGGQPVDGYKSPVFNESYGQCLARLDETKIGMGGVCPV
ncbi:MAG: hypothetical protein H6868_09480 [Rhodospirillales bacterium]|nr:hypothetical protein [Rhodospirillales bacterium]